MENLEKQAYPRGGVTIRKINFAFIFVVLFFSVGTGIVNYYIEKRYNNTVSSEEALLACSDAADAFQKESDSLTFYLNSYLEDPEEETLTAYFQIIDSESRRQELDRVQELGIDSSSLEEAETLSDELTVWEIHALKLAYLANGGELSEAPEQLQTYELPKTEQNLTEEGQLDTAKELAYGKEYNDFKREIYTKLEEFKQKIVSGTREDLVTQTNAAVVLLNYQKVLVVVENLLVACLAVLLYRQVTLVLRDYIQKMSEGETVSANGTTELRYLAKAYNQSIELHHQEQAVLRKIAEKDALTQVANRRSLEEYVTHKLQQNNVHGAVVFFDVDGFKTINDTYGHEVGDELLKNIVQRMQRSFRDEDFIGRFGGDEFVLWIEDITRENAGFIKERIAAINGTVLELSGVAIALSISAGITFCHTGEEYKDVLRRADAALYEKKRNGKEGCVVYEEME